ncbi:hypothetical protein ACFL9U_08615 [Thermodesulfobacteriota bacterium]
MNRKYPKKPFVYLIQSESDLPYPNLPDARNDIILLTWKKPSNLPNSVFYPGSSWNEGRNRLLSEAVRISKSTGNAYLYYVFLDEDCIVKEDEALAEKLHVPLTGNPFRTFERYLLEWEPAVGYTRYSWQYHEPEKETNLGYNIDAIFNAFHRETLSFLLPYYTGFDKESWLYSQHIINHLTALLYNPHRIQFNVITTKNRCRQTYPHRKKDWSKPTAFLLNAIKSALKEKMSISDPNTVIPLPGRPLKKARSYVISRPFIEKHFDIHHPFIQDRQWLLNEIEK